MKKLYLLLIGLFLNLMIVSGQHFVLDPTDNYVDEIPLNTYTSHKVFMENLTGGVLTLSWERLYIDFPSEWNYDLCDFGGCYVGIPQSGTMQNISDTIHGYLDITLNANDRTGVGVVVFNVFDYKHPDESDTLTFTIHAGSVTGISSTVSQEGFSVYPNPATSYFKVTTPAMHEAILTLTNLQGQVLIKDKISTEKDVSYNVDHLPTGLYFISITDRSGKLERKKLLIN